jgi:hypothetical protein
MMPIHGFGQPAPVHTQPPALQSMMQVPSHWNVQPPPEQLKSHEALLGHHAEQSPPEQSMLHGTFGAQ